MSTPVAPTLQPASWYERRVRMADGILAGLALVVLGIMGANVVGVRYGWPAIFIPLAMCGLVAIRRTRPELYVGGTALLAIVEMALFPTTSGAPTDILVLVAVHTAARYCAKWFGYAALALAVIGAFWASYYWVYRPPENVGFEPAAAAYVVSSLVLSGMAVISYALGRAQLAKTRAIEAQVAALAERSRLLQHEHEQQMRLATEEERGRLAAETHDILAHSLAVIVAQADGAAMMVEKNPERARQAIEQIGKTSREALAEIRVKVAALRRGEDPSTDLAPARSLLDLPALVQTVGRAGLEVSLSTHGDLAGVPAGTSLSAYRVVQEALTNTLKHAGPRASAAIDICRSDGVLHVLVEDDGRGLTSADGAGNGLRGMRARVEQYGGVLNAGPRVGGGFAVRASIPLPPTERKA